ncbi:GDSL-like Lipase/Acylhydrolase family [Bifidobacterium sp. DSM 109958]|uniref:GDSL-like Lipase/Acylhydrolase family n=1 Tax=Bifidobacterium moraviense TaxID=2675323 RepID=A0A7Y0F2S3_9BIFI|nr:rhamnogalacturonan acetylesterase [Bifidobacterium sp. DSM 109958]NMN00948.1 GDSL-like Lipase/Acylhydrolase family [Bifidobacterium sp. DSM 109958]
MTEHAKRMRTGDAELVAPDGGPVAYDAARGWGLVTPQVRADGAVPPDAELNGGFGPFGWYRPGMAFRAGQTSGFVPSVVRVDVPAHGSYRVRLVIDGHGPDARHGDVSDTGLDGRDVLVFAGDRQLAYRGELPADGSPLEVEAVVNVSDFVPRGHQAPQAVGFVALAVVGAHARPVRVHVEPMDDGSGPACGADGTRRTPVVWIAGDSTVTDEGAQYPYAPSDPYCGWGAMLPAWLDLGVAVSNHARSGLTTLTFRSGRHYEPVRADWRPGDYLVIQFGHNDQKRPELDARGGYRRELARYVAEARAAGVRPILVTSLARNTWNPDGTYHDLLRDWAQAVIELGRDEHVPVVDLHALSMALVTGLGDEGARPMYHAGDRTHMHDVGAYRIAGMVAGELRRVLGSWDAGADSAEARDYRALAGHVTRGFGDWPLPPRAHDVDRPQLVVDQYLDPLYLKYTAEPYVAGDISPFRKVRLLTPIPGAASADAAAPARRPLDVLLYVGEAIDPEPVVAARPALADALAAGHVVALVAYRTEEITQDPALPIVPVAAMGYLAANADRFGIDPRPASITLAGPLP